MSIVEPMQDTSFTSCHFIFFLAAITPATLIQWVTRHKNARAYFLVTLGLALIFTISSLEPLQNEYDFVQSDWKGIVQHLANNFEEEDVILGFTLSHPNGFNPVYHALPYYLERAELTYKSNRK